MLVQHLVFCESYDILSDWPSNLQEFKSSTCDLSQAVCDFSAKQALNQQAGRPVGPQLRTHFWTVWAGGRRSNSNPQPPQRLKLRDLTHAWAGVYLYLCICIGCACASVSHCITASVLLYLRLYLCFNSEE